MRLGHIAWLAGLGCTLMGHADAVAADRPGEAASLKPVAGFSTIADPQARSAALFQEAARVITSPRCMNCHPATRQPTQGDDLHPHVPLMVGGAGGHGAPSLPCRSCHGPETVATLGAGIASIPGNSHWGLAPASMAWQGKSLRDICEQIKDPKRNGGRSLADLHTHMSTDKLVGWAWAPGPGRIPAPGTQAEFGQLIQAWISSGASCPQS
jgi:hypothetical protein